jgi:predicted Zn-dependent protease
MRRIAEKIFKFSDADETEVEIGAITDALTRFANNTIHQNVAEQSLAVSVRTVLDGRTARATTNKTDDDSLRRVVETAKSLARSESSSVLLVVARAVRPSSTTRTEIPSVCSATF